MILFPLIILSTVSFGFAEKTLPDSDITWAEQLPSEDPSSNHEDEDKSSVNVEEILRDNRDLNQTISDILEMIADLEDVVIRNEEKITENQRQVLMVQLDVEDNINRIDAICHIHQGEMVRVQ